MSAVPDAEVAAICKKLGAADRTAADVVGALSVLECARRPRVNAEPGWYGIDARDTATFTVRLAWTGVVSDDDVHRLAAASPRVVDVRAVAPHAAPATRQVRVVVRRASVDAAAAPVCTYVPPATAAKRGAHLVWDAADEHDRERLDALVDAVYSMHARMPVVRAWCEPIVAGRASAAADDDALEVLVEPNTDASESEGGGAAVGYALCFAGVDDVPGDFFAYLHRRFGPTVARVAVWLPPPGADADAVLVVNVRRAALDAAAGADAARTHALRGDPLARRRVRARRTK